MEQCYGILPSMLRKFDRYARRDSFRGDTRGEFEQWRSETRSLLHGLLGLDKMEDCGLSPVLEDVLLLPGGIRREHIRIQVEPDVWMPMFVLVPPGAGCSSRPFICPPGHNGAGKYSVAGLDGYGPVRDKIRQYHYDYGYQLAKLDVYKRQVQVNTASMSGLICMDMGSHLSFNLKDVAGEVDKHLTCIGGLKTVMYPGE